MNERLSGPSCRRGPLGPPHREHDALGVKRDPDARTVYAAEGRAGSGRTPSDLRADKRRARRRPEAAPPVVRHGTPGDAELQGHPRRGLGCSRGTPKIEDEEQQEGEMQILEIGVA
ncbi:hypothetical protein EYF80_031204 [Liparis tanakae]|uniref:Uncharacterized protein n=1 Tax=Liparis tanakae TaxID=230148 RepID=A0A4Z2H174_9TELE|nr:hypothetical protein EYF80_031204 [Liparis tanakae]